ncbi:phospholipid:diacylglycerol acyltransferase [Friedmanniomyces endolithicus]|nr:phospholipid:diacylglycerol acyltransferase [Friedmanniomyces endolithicus]KAK0836042.1 phospholipid:diacylglycerol acyltransferase [Friedmanniomyces endolithicus]
MSDLRRRIFGFGVNSPDSTPASSRDASPAPTQQDENTANSYTVVPAAKLDKLSRKGKKQATKRRNVWIFFVLGGLLGVLVAGFFATSNGGLDKLADMAGLSDMNLDAILDVLPAGLIQEVRDLQTPEKDVVNYDSFAIGLQARSEGVSARYPVIMIPGVISTGLESWGTEEQSRQYFRKRLWGSWTMMRALVLDKTSWKRHIMLDPDTGLDPPGIKLRAAQGFDAADFFITGYWIWNKILENLATIGYDPTNAFTAAYDWRLSYMNYEKRDQYFTRLRNHIELGKQVSGLKVVLLSHSMGSQVLYYFLHWVEAEGYGNGGPSWVNDHIESWINISGCMLGALKDVPAVLSGEMRDTAQLNALAVYGLEKFLSRQERAEIFRRMPGISSMLPIGGEAVWGDHISAPDDRPGQNITYGNFLSFRQSGNDSANSSTPSSNLTMGQALPYLFAHTQQWYRDATQQAYSRGVAHTRKVVEDNQHIPAKWINPLETRLPLAPDLKIYCFYGIDKPTERAYFYRDDPASSSSGNNTTAGDGDPRVMIDTSHSTPDSFVDRGVIMGEGDGTVNLLSTGYMCNKGWKMKRYNPAGIKVTTHEMRHEPDRFSARGGPNTGDHVDILGRSSLNDLILRIAGGQGDKIETKVYSDILMYADKVKIYDDEVEEA